MKREHVDGHLWDAISTERKQHGLTLEQVAEWAGVTPEFVTRLEAGQPEPGGGQKANAVLAALGLRIGAHGLERYWQRSFGITPPLVAPKLPVIEQPWDPKLTIAPYCVDQHGREWVRLVGVLGGIRRNILTPVATLRAALALLPAAHPEESREGEGERE